MEEGIIAGAGIPLYCMAEKLMKDEDEGVQIVGRALMAPSAKLLENAGIENRPVSGRLDSSNFGTNLETGECGDLFEMGIIDPAKVTRNAIQNAASVAAAILTCEAVIVEEKKSKKEEEDD